MGRSEKLFLLWLVCCFCSLSSACTEECGSYLGAQRLEDGSTVVCEACEDYRKAKVVRVSPDGSELWSYRYPEADMRFPHSATWNPDDTLIIADTGRGRIIVVDSYSKQIIWNSREVTFSDPEVHFYYTNYARFLPNGNILTSLRNGHIVLEVQLDGQITWSFGEPNIPAKDDTHLNGPHWPQRLANGNTLIPDSWNHRVIEVNAAGEIVWNYEPTEEPYLLNWPRCSQELENGNILITDPHDHFEVTREGQVVKHFSRPYNTTDWGYAGYGLENGNYLLCGYHRIDELTPEGEIVWTYAPSWGPPPAPILIE